ncbi:MAG: sigma 54-interacting transcriptional regulator [Reichenbachiella sp.]
MNKIWSEKLSSATFNYSSNPIVWVNSSARICNVNPAFIKSVGYTHEELLTMSVHDINPDFSRDTWETHWKEFRVQKHFTAETTHRHKDGSTFPVEISTNYIIHEDDEFSCVFVKNITERKETEKKFQEYLFKIEKLSSQLQEERDSLSEEIGQTSFFETGIFQDTLSVTLADQIEQVAPTLATVLITGESGTGKEVVARRLHRSSQRASSPMIKVNCAALPTNLIESELFGHKKGAFTGATTDKKGKFLLAHNGTLFLDEVGELPLEVQAKFLRVLQEGEIDPIGSETYQNIDVRIIAATNRDLLKEVKEGRFREDLYYRLTVFPLSIAPLRERPNDIPPLVNHFIKKHATKMGTQVLAASDTTLSSIQAYSWPGNIRELENIITRGLIFSKGKLLFINQDWIPSISSTTNSSPLPEPSSNQSTPLSTTPSILTLAQLEKLHILDIWEKCNKVIEGPNGAAQKLGISYNTLRRKLKKHAI